jgi:molybdopterin molybdotransferase
MISFQNALAIIEDVAKKIRTEQPLDLTQRSLKDAVGAVLAEDLLSPEDLPSFDNSAMDGFALRSSETTDATQIKPIILTVSASVVAGDAAPHEEIARHSAVEIMTGAPVPEGLDAIAKIEDVVVERSAEGRPLRIQIKSPVAAQSFVRSKGNDLREGQLVLSKGTRINPPSILALASLGFAKVLTFRRFKLARISTGKEVVSHDAPLNAGQVRNSTAPYFATVLPLYDADLVYENSVGDDPADFVESVRAALALDPDVLFTSGAVSMGKHDYVVDVIKSLGATVHFHKVAIQPGKPLLFATFPNGTALFGLPGNPVSGTVGVRFFAETFLRTLRYQPAERPIRVPVLKAAKKPPGLTQLAKAIVKFEEGRAFASLMAGQMSSMVSPLLEANAWAIVESEAATIEEGQTVDVYPVLSTQPFF